MITDCGFFDFHINLFVYKGDVPETNESGPIFRNKKKQLLVNDD